MKTIKSLLLLVVLALGFGGVACADTPATSTYWWHTSSQSQRNSLIVNRASQYIGSYTGLSCKEWARKVVYEASGNHVSIPPNMPAPYNYMWQNDSSGHVVAMGIPIQEVVPGNVIQMRLVSGPEHTVIVIAKTGTTVTFAESNFDSTPGVESDAYVKTPPRTITFAEFYSQVEGGGAYFVYVIR